MNAGLPTTGIGGIFYFLCVIAMFFIEIFRTIKRQSSLKQWKFVFEHLLMLSIMLAMVWATGVFLLKVVPQGARQVLITTSTSVSSGNIQVVFLTPFIILGIILILTQLLRGYLLLSRKLKVK